MGWFLDWILSIRGMLIIKIFFIVLLTIIISKVAKIVMLKSLRQEKTILKQYATELTLMRHGIDTFVYLIGIAMIIYTIPSLRAVSVSLLAGAGVLAVVIGFAAQQALSNIIGGISIIISRPYEVGNRVKLDNGNIYGTVEDITLRHTVVKNLENNRYFIPNSIAASTIIENHSIKDSRVLKQIEFLIGYESDIDKATKIIRKVIMKHPGWVDVRTNKEIKDNVDPLLVKVIELADSGVKIRAYAWTKDPTSAFNLFCDVTKTVKEQFDKNKIEIPYPHRTIVYKK